MLHLERFRHPRKQPFSDEIQLRIFRTIYDNGDAGLLYEDKTPQFWLACKSTQQSPGLDFFELVSPILPVGSIHSSPACVVL